MTTGYVVQGRGDLDVLFKARTSAAIANTGFLSNGGVDLAQRFEPRGAATPILSTGFLKAGTDLAQLFQGISADSIGLSDVNWQAIGSTNPASIYRLTSAGDIIRSNTGVITDEGDWIAPKASAPGAYEVRATVAAGGPPTSGTLNTWLPLSTTREWSMVRPTPPSGSGTSTVSLTIEIRDGSAVVKATAFVTLRATVP